MSEWEVGLVILFGMLLLGVPIGLALTFVGTVGTVVIIGIDRRCRCWARPISTTAGPIPCRSCPCS